MKNENITVGNRILAYFIAIVFGFAASFALMLIFAALATAADLGDAFATPFTSISLALGGVVSGFISSKKLKRGGLLNGALCGAVIFTVILIISLLIDEGGITLNTLFNLIISLLSAGVGGVWGTGNKNKLKI